MAVWTRVSVIVGKTRMVDRLARWGGEAPAAALAVGGIARLWPNGSAQRAPTSLAAAVSMDGESVAALAQAALSDEEGLRAAVVSRPPEASTGPLERLWRRFADSGTQRGPLVGRQAVSSAMAALKPIVPCEDMPAARPHRRFALRTSGRCYRPPP